MSSRTLGRLGLVVMVIAWALLGLEVLLTEAAGTLAHQAGQWSSVTTLDAGIVLNSLSEVANRAARRVGFATSVTLAVAVVLLVAAPVTQRIERKHASTGNDTLVADLDATLKRIEHVQRSVAVDVATRDAARAEVEQLKEVLKVARPQLKAIRQTVAPGSRRMEVLAWVGVALAIAGIVLAVVLA